MAEHRASARNRGRGPKIERLDMVSITRRSAMALVGLLVLGAGALAAQTTYPNVKITGRLQEQFYYLDNDPYPVVGPNSNFFTRRARIEAKGNIAENVSFIIQPSFEGGRTLSSLSATCQDLITDPTAVVPDTLEVECSISGRGGVRLRDAYIEVAFTKPEAKNRFALRVGQEKRPFGRYELTSSNNLPSLERGAGQGLLQVASNNLFDANGFLSHDVGASLLVGLSTKGTVQLGVYNGRGESVNDNNNAKSYGARATFQILPQINIGASYFSHDGIVAGDSSATNNAWGVDAQWGKVGDEGLYVVADYMDGEAANAANTPIRGVSVVAAYHMRMKSPTSWLYAIEPAVRYDVADTDTDVDDTGTTLVSAGINLYMSSKAQLRFMYENQSFSASGAESISGVRSALTVNF
jgi:phosphate-selective porin O/P